MLCQYASVIYRMEQNKTLIINLNLAMSISTKAHAQLSNEHGTETHLKVPKEGTDKSIVINIEIATR